MYDDKLEIKKGKKPIKISKKETVKISWKFIYIPIIALISIYALIKLNVPSIEQAQDSVVMLEVFDKNDNLTATGSGFSAFKSNYIVTNFHVIEGAYKIKVITDDGESYIVDNILVFNKEYDLAILSGNFEINPLQINSKSIKVGQEVTAIGSPKGQKNTVSKGIISNSDNDFEIRITAPISPGSSGGVLLDKYNKLVGITNAVYNSSDAQNLNYAIGVKYLNLLYDAFLNQEYHEISEVNIFDCYNAFEFMDIAGSISFNSCSDSQVEFYTINNIELFHNLTNKRNIFETNLSQKCYDDGFIEECLNPEIASHWNTVYELLPESNKEDVVLNYENLISNYFCIEKKSCNIEVDVHSWNPSEFFINLEIIDRYLYSLIIEDMKKSSTKQEQVNSVKNYPLTVAQKSLILFLLGDYNFEEIGSSNREEIFNYIDQKDLTAREKTEILKVLGFTIRYINGEPRVYW